MRERLSILFALIALWCIPTEAQNFSDYFTENTLRLDYIFAGDTRRQSIYVDELSRIPGWYGRKHRLSELPLKGNGQITVMDKAKGIVIYRHSFSTLFQEWLSTEEARRTSKAFENVFLVPYPKQTVEITVELQDCHGNTTASLTHTVSPDDILIKGIGESNITPFEVLQQAADSMRNIHIAYIAEGYRKEEMEQFKNDARTAMKALFAHEPFKSMQNRFNVIAVMPESEESGASEPRNGIWKRTALNSHFDTFYTDRYLTTLHLKKLHNLLAGTPYEHIIILVNTDKYGGGGIYNSYNLSYTKGKQFMPVVVHEFGHSFGGLGDEYAYGDNDPMYFPDTEPWEPNLTTKHDFKGKWENLIAENKAGMIEGGGYQTKGVFRGAENCRMRTNDVPDFCAVCQQALRRLIEFYTK